MGRMFCTDVDGTLHRWQAVFAYLHALGKKRPEIRQLLDDAHSRFIAYKQRRGTFMEYASYLIRRYFDEELYVGVTMEESMQAAHEALEEQGNDLYVFTTELIWAAKECDMKLAAISGSPQDAIVVLLERFGMHAIRGGQRQVVDGVYVSGEAVDDPFHYKGRALTEIAEKFGDIDLTQSIAIGDSQADVPMLELVGYPICFKPNRELHTFARVRGWPIVIEDRNTHHYSILDVRRGCRRDTVVLTDFLPSDVARALEKRLAKRHW